MKKIIGIILLVIGGLGTLSMIGNLHLPASSNSAYMLGYYLGQALFLAIITVCIWGGLKLIKTPQKKSE